MSASGTDHYHETKTGYGSENLNLLFENWNKNIAEVLKLQAKGAGPETYIELYNELKGTAGLLANYYANLSEADQIKMLKKVLEKSNAVLLQEIFKHEREHKREDNFNKKITSLPPDEVENAQFLLDLLEDDMWSVTELIHASSTIGSMTYLGGLLTCSQIASRKHNYDFMPTVLRMNEFDEYLQTLQGTPYPHRERFVITGTHWLAGDINITKDGRVSVLFLDSVGIKAMPRQKYFKEVLPIFKKFAEIFTDGVIYIPALQRQHALQGCSVYALDDVRHLYTVEDHLEAKFNKSGLHGYLAASVRQAKTAVHDELKMATPCRLPLSLVRTMQSKQLFEVIKERSKKEKAVSINKKGEKLNLDYVHNRLLFNPQQGYDMNQRIQWTAEKIAKFNTTFIRQQCSTRSIPVKEIIPEVTHPYTLDGFKHRMTHKNQNIPKAGGCCVIS